MFVVALDVLLFEIFFTKVLKDSIPTQQSSFKYGETKIKKERKTFFLLLDVPTTLQSQPSLQQPPLPTPFSNNPPPTAQSSTTPKTSPSLTDICNFQDTDLHSPILTDMLFPLLTDMQLARTTDDVLLVICD